jgi:hypothetical protein
MDAVWSPDGTQLAMLVHHDVWIVDADGSDLHSVSLARFVHRVGNPYAIAWRPIP